MAVMEINNGKCSEAYKLKIFDDNRVIKTDAWLD